ncbi:MAG: hypothetical protein M1326_04190 [Cyanobacteria bacterium]|nr:hypothetical protein [Cyanobacteriota bacterium]
MEELAFCYPFRKLNFADSGEKFDNYIVSKKDKIILKELAIKKAEIAELSIHKEKIELWKKLNSLKEVRPLIWINEIPWHEMNVNNELTLKTTTKFAQFLETRLRRVIYRWNHMAADMVVEPTLPCYLIVDDTGFGISEKVEIARTDNNSDVYSRGFIPQIKNEEDLDKIKTPIVEYDEKSTNEMFESMNDIFNGILLVEKTGFPGFWFAPWDELIRWWGVQELFTDLILRPGFVHKAINKLTEAYLNQLDQYEKLNLLSLNNRNYRIGSGGLGYTDELPQRDFNHNHVRTIDLWGNCAAQIFAGVSPEMHDEFALQYEINWMKRFGLNYYGCCEPLDKKIDILRKIPNLRKISMSPWVNLELGAANIGKDYVFSFKPSPAIFSEDKWDSESIREKFREDLKIIKSKGCIIEVLMKDISTVRYKPERLWEWANIAVEEANRFD